MGIQYNADEPRNAPKLRSRSNLLTNHLPQLGDFRRSLTQFPFTRYKKPMTRSDVSSDLSEWQRTFTRELSIFLEELGGDSRVYGLTLELPSDFSNDGIIARIARCPDGVESRVHVAKSRDLEADWEYDPSGFGDCCDSLQSLYAKYKKDLADEDFYTEFGNLLYDRCLEAMQQSADAGQFGKVWLRFLSLSDDDNAIVGKSIDTLNDDQGKAIARLLI